MLPPDAHCDVAIVGAGAAGLAAAIVARRAHPDADVLVLDSARKVGAKILVSGGGRCNVTNTVVTEADFWGGKRTIVRRILRALPVQQTVEFFSGLGVALHEEPGGKLFPDTNRARDVLEALLRGVDQTGARLRTATRVTGIAPAGPHFHLSTSDRAIAARRVVLATGGRSLPKSGSDGGGYALAVALGHTLVAQTPALAPLLLDPASDGIHERLSGVSIDAELSIWIEGTVAIRLQGALLWTHFGISGPLALNASRHWARARLEGRDVRVTLSVYPGEAFDRVDSRWTALAVHGPDATVRRALAAEIPDGMARALLDVLQIDGSTRLADFRREDRRRLVHALTAWPLLVTDTRGYNFAEVTAGGVPLTEIDPGTMASRVCPGLFLVGEILDVDGRIGGFNFQWAWATAHLAGHAVGQTGVKPGSDWGQTGV